MQNPGSNFIVRRCISWIKEMTLNGYILSDDVSKWCSLETMMWSEVLFDGFHHPCHVGFSDHRQHIWLFILIFWLLLAWELVDCLFLHSLDLRCISSKDVIGRLQAKGFFVPLLIPVALGWVVHCILATWFPHDNLHYCQWAPEIVWTVKILLQNYFRAKFKSYIYSFSHNAIILGPHAVCAHCFNWFISGDIMHCSRVPIWGSFMFL